MTVASPGTSVMRLRPSVSGAVDVDAGPEPKEAMIGATVTWPATRLIPVAAESPVAPVATIECSPSEVSGGIVIWVVNEPFPFEFVDSRGTPWLKSVRRIDSSCTKFWPKTVREPPGDTKEALVEIAAAWGPSNGRATAATCHPNPTTRLAAAQA